MHPASKESVAYDYSRFDNRKRVRDANEIKEYVPKKETRPAPKTNMFGKAVAFIAVMLVMSAIIMNYVKLTELSDQAYKLQQQYNALREEEAVLIAQKEQKFTLENVEKYAVQNLGMVKLDQSQITYVELTNPDKVEIADEEEQTSTFMRGFLKAFNVVVEYLN